MKKLIKEIKGYEVLDSRGNPTVAARVILNDSSEGFAISPSGASTGAYEAHELRDNDKSRYGGKGVSEAVTNINDKIYPALVGMDCENQTKIDETINSLDPTESKKVLGANATLAVSLAAAKAAANHFKMPLFKYLGGVNATVLPRPMMNILNGGAHAKNNIDIQEFMIVPTAQIPFSENIRKCTEIYHTLGSLLKNYDITGVGDEGGFAPNLKDDETAIELICSAIEKAGYTTDEFKIALDVASSEWYDSRDGFYYLPKRQKKLASSELIEYYANLTQKYPIISLEDPLSEDDWGSWKIMTEKMGSELQLVGDDLFVTNATRLEIGFDYRAANAVLIKPNQIGTLSETLEVIRLAQKNNYSTILSHRSGETEDTTIADIAVATNCGQIKTGAPCRTDRVAKYNRLLMIESML
ncbi:MAG: phosphopyruvate hydratase [Ruminococcaceae bacterium]|nr:phosphopyruvate hydratase [Oscillospiraceae bacterium]